MKTLAPFVEIVEQTADLALKRADDDTRTALKNASCASVVTFATSPLRALVVGERADGQAVLVGMLAGDELPPGADAAVAALLYEWLNALDAQQRAEVRKGPPHFSVTARSWPAASITLNQHDANGRVQLLQRRALSLGVSH